MIKFKKDYTQGPWEVDHSFDVPRIYDENDNLIAEVWNGDNANLMAVSQKMAEYMMRRAKKLKCKINMYYYNPSAWVDTDKKKEAIEELQEIISNLKDAGVEVLENKCLSCSAWGNVCGPDDYPDYICSTYNCEYFTNNDGEL